MINKNDKIYLLYYLLSTLHYMTRIGRARGTLAARLWPKSRQATPSPPPPLALAKSVYLFFFALISLCALIVRFIQTIPRGYKHVQLPAVMWRAES